MNFRDSERNFCQNLVEKLGTKYFGFFFDFIR